jgi:DNA-binding CsgD family transcriptional regulator/tetratricopeptide (TPR) repeat protein
VTDDGELLERGTVLARLRALAEAAASGDGRLVLLTGEAGIGKSALLHRLVDDLDGGIRVWSGACERLFAARPLGPLADMLPQLPDEVAGAVRRAAPAHEVLPSLLEALHATPTLLVIEDVHWADEATLDLVALLGRRLRGTRGLGVVTCRDDELAADHQLRVVLGGLAAASVERIALPALSIDAVRRLAAGGGVDAGELFRMTGGNPFYVTEVLAAGGRELPLSVRDAVLARAAALEPEARSLLESLSVVTGAAPPELVAELGGPSAAHLGACLASGMLVESGAGVAFRHDLARMAIAEGVDPLRRIALNRIALRVLRAAGADPARLAHHADEARDAAAVEEFAPLAAFDAVARCAHREAAAQFGRALRPHRRIVDAQRAALLEQGAYAQYLTDHFDEAIDWLHEAIAIRHATGDARGEGDAWRRMSNVQRCGGRAGEAIGSGQRAVALLEGAMAGRELAAAYANLAMLALNANDVDAGRVAVDRAIELLDRNADRDLLVHTLNTRGFLRVLDGDDGGLADLEESLALSLAAGLDEHVGRAYIHLADIAQRDRRWDLFDGERGEAAELFCADHGIELWWRYVRVYRARIAFDQGRWAEALAGVGRDFTAANPLARIVPLVVAGLVAARRGVGDPWPALYTADELARRSGELQWVAPVTAARLEAAWLGGRGDGLARDAVDVLRLCDERHAGWWAGEIAWWRRCAGFDDGVPPGSAEPWALLLQGRAAESAAAWRRIGCPYEEALALATSDDPADLRAAFERFDALEARPAAAATARRMRSLGLSTVPRGVRRSTRGNPAGLTSREVEVLRLLARGLRNTEIAADLVVSTKTVDHHVSAVLRKLGVNDRRAAVRAAVDLGLLDEPAAPDVVAG